MLQLADCGLKDLETLQACNRLREGIPLYNCEGEERIFVTRFDVYETLCPQQMLVDKGGLIKNWSGECIDVIPTKLQCQAIQRALQSPNLQREIIQFN